MRAIFAAIVMCAALALPTNSAKAQVFYQPYRYYTYSPYGYGYTPYAPRVYRSYYSPYAYGYSYVPRYAYSYPAYGYWSY